MLFVSGKRPQEFHLVVMHDLYLLALECTLWLFCNGSNVGNVNKLFSGDSSRNDEMRRCYFGVVGKSTWQNILIMH
jgi:hypothetical protein